MVHYMEGALIIQVNVRHDPSGVYYANSPGLKGLHVCASSLDVLRERVVKSIKAIFKHSRNLAVEVSPEADSAESFPEPKPSLDRFIVHRR